MSRQPASEQFRECFGRDPQVVVRAPGRVNLIGEHTDYNGLPVLPFAIGQAHRIAAAASGNPAIQIANADPRYPAQTIAPDDLASFSPPGAWDNYLRAAFLGLMDAGLLGRESLARGLQVFVSSDLPSSVGLSSSSALVVGFALAALHVFGIEYDRQALAEVLAEAEHYVGTRGGGMDQTVCLLGREGHALRIDFFPLAVEPVGLAGDVEVLLADSGVRVEKSGQGLALYNRRPVECRLALDVFKSWARTRGHADLAQARYWGDLVKPPLALSHEAVLSMVREALKGDRYSSADLCRLLEVQESELRDTYLEAGPGTSVLDLPDGFKLRQRAEHVIAEAHRVDQAVKALHGGDWPRLAGLINASHASCRDLYEISCPELERLVAEATEAGALGSRLTGAGFGGCTLHLVARAEADRFEAEMARRLRGGQRLFRVAPSQGAQGAL